MMTSIIRFQALSGVNDESPPSYLLQVDQFQFLLDCGWDESCSMDYIDNIKKYIKQIDAVLLSYPDPYHLGALPYLVGKCGLSCPIYATIPVYKMGQMFMYDLYQAHHNTEDFNVYTLDDVDAAFDKIMQLKYSQTVGLRGKGHGLQITPIPAGHMIGGTIWKILKDGEEEIIYAVDYNHKKERHLNGCMLDNILRPALLITDAYNADYNQPRRRQRDEQLMTKIVHTVRNSGNVLVALDTAGRILELAHLLDQMWRSQGSGLMAYSLALLNNVSYNVVEFAKSQVEWMSDKIMRSFEEARNNPFQFKHVVLCHSLAELSKVPEPKVVLASVPDLECGFSRELFMQWCGNSRNTIILTSRTNPGTLARTLIDSPNLKQLTLEVRRRIRLEGYELEEYKRKQREKEAEEIKLRAEQDRREREELESSDDSDAEMEMELGGPSVKAKHDLMMKSEGRVRSGFFKQARKAYPMFPFSEERLKWDDYGEIIKPDDFVLLDSNAPEEEVDKDTNKKDEESKKELTEVPTKCVKTIQTFDILADVVFIDFEGRSDGESVKKIITQIKPRQLILVHGNPTATGMLKDFILNSKEKIVEGTTFVPKVNEIIDATKESHIYQVKLKDSLVSSLQLLRAKDCELAWIDAYLNTNWQNMERQTSDIEQEKDDMDSEIVDYLPLLENLPQKQVSGHMAVFINEPKLSDFKQVLIAEGIQAEFSGGVLICNGIIAIRKNESGKMQLEGALCDEYYKIRNLLYDQYAIV